MPLPPVTPNQNAIAVVAIGGNSLVIDRSHQSIPHQWEAVRETAVHIADMIEMGWRVVVTHGNGPQVGFILRKNELAKDYVHTIPIDIIVSNTQGSIGYMIQQALTNEFHRRGVERSCITILTQTLVDLDDPAFAKPTKPIGRFLDHEEAKRYQNDGWAIVEDAGRGWRRVVASPAPRAILEHEQIQRSLGQGDVVIAVGGGGIPVVRNRHGELRGVEAVVDKDLASSLLASQLNASLLLISTGVERVSLNFGQPDQINLGTMTVAEATEYNAQGHFGPGSMKPKIEGCIGFLHQSGHTDACALITNPQNIAKALKGETGTRVMLG